MTNTEKRKEYTQAQNKITPILIRWACDGKSTNNCEDYRRLFAEYKRLERLLSYL